VEMDCKLKQGKWTDIGGWDIFHSHLLCYLDVMRDALIWH
jgi:hypothetical protein